MIRTASLASLLALLPAAAVAQEPSDAAMAAKTSEAERAAMAGEMRVGPVVGEPAPAVTDEPTIKMPPIDGSAIPSDFRLSLDELKFGRNYGGDK